MFVNKQIFIINGSGGVGKDTFVKLVALIVDGAPRINHQTIINFSSVNKVKEIARAIGWNGDKTEKDRKFLSDLKLLCTEYNDMPFLSMKETVDKFNNSDARILFLHIREPEEIERAVKAFNAKTILIKREAVEHITSNMADKNVFNYDYDIVINNDETLEDLANKAEYFVKKFAPRE